jgi:hypothetical protein
MPQRLFYTDCSYTGQFEAPKFAFPTSFQVLLMLLILRPHFENCLEPHSWPLSAPSLPPSQGMKRDHPGPE